MAQKALFLDRDGTIIIDRDYPGDPDEVEFIRYVPESLRIAQNEYLLIVISNQSGVGRGLITHEQFEKVDQQFRKLLKAENIHVDGFYYCIHAPEEDCDCRKPKPGMILEAAEKLGIDLSESYMIGDKKSDVEAGLRAGCKAIQVQGTTGTINRDEEFKPADKYHWGPKDFTAVLEPHETKGLTDRQISRLLDEREKTLEAPADLNSAVAMILSKKS